MKLPLQVIGFCFLSSVVFAKRQISYVQNLDTVCTNHSYLVRIVVTNPSDKKQTITMTGQLFATYAISGNCGDTASYSPGQNLANLFADGMSGAAHLGGSKFEINPGGFISFALSGTKSGGRAVALGSIIVDEDSGYLIASGGIASIAANGANQGPFTINSGRPF